MRLSTVRRVWSLMCLCVVMQLFSLILKNFHCSVTADCSTLLSVSSRAYLRGELTLLEISESIYCFVFRLYSGAFVTFHHIRFFFYSTIKLRLEQCLYARKDNSSFPLQSEVAQVFGKISSSSLLKLVWHRPQVPRKTVYNQGWLPAQVPGRISSSIRLVYK